MKGSLIILLFFSLGVFLGYKAWLPEVLLTTDFSSYALYVLMFLVGISMGVDVKAFKALKHMKLKIIAIPITTIVGTAIGVTVVWLLLSDILLKDAWAIGAGYGYYSLSSIYISEVRGETLGLIALLSNVIREIITLVAAPLMVKWFGKLAPIVSGGATSMDTTLPIISQTSGTEYAIVSVFHGTVLTILVPVLVTFFMGL
jgi:uncharacterized membrane protein YbjE (DUF340 family)